MTSTWKRLLQHTRILTDSLTWCQKWESGHLPCKSHHGKPQISGQEEEHADVITAGGPDPALKDYGAGAAIPRVPQGRCPQHRHAAWHGVRRGLGGKPACLPGGKWETPTSRSRARCGHHGRLQGGGLAQGTPALPCCDVPPVPAHPRHLEAGMQTASCTPHELSPLLFLLSWGVSTPRGRDVGVSSPLVHHAWGVAPIGEEQGLRSPMISGGAEGGKLILPHWKRTGTRCGLACSWGSGNVNGLAFCSGETVKKEKRPMGGRERNPVQLQSGKQSRGKINMKTALEKRETKEEKRI